MQSYFNIDMDKSEYSDFLDDYITWLESQNPEQANSQEKHTDSDHLPDVGKKVLTQKQINEIIQCANCKVCLHDNLRPEEYPCSDCDDFDRFNAELEYINKVNKLLEGK
jgi:hypothetical protein